MKRSLFIIVSVIFLWDMNVFGPAQVRQSEQEKKITELIGILGTRYWDKAADELVEIGKPAVDLLVATLNAGSGRPAENAVIILGRIGTPEALDAVVVALKNKNFHNRVRAYAAMALGDTGSEDQVEVLIESLRTDDHWWVRNFAVGSLGKIGSRRVVDPLIEAMDDENMYVRRAAVEIIGKLKPEKAVLPLIEALKDEDWQIKLRVPAILVEFGTRAEEPLLEALEDEDIWINVGSAQVLGRIGNTDAVLPLIFLLEHREQMVRDEAAVALSRINAERAVAPLVHLLNHEKGYVREEASWVLGEMRSEDAVRPLIEALEDKETGWMAAVSLGKIGDERAVEPLKEKMMDGDSRVGQAAAWALERMRERHPGPLERWLGSESRNDAEK
jgi:HEAT repeat protein